MTWVGLTKPFPILCLSIPLALCPPAAVAQAQDLKVEIVPVTPHNMVEAVAFSPNGTQVLSGGFDNTMKLWDVATGRLLRTFKGHTYVVRSVAFSPDGTKVLSASQDTTLKLWDAASGRLLRTFTGHKETVTSVAFSPDGSRFVSGSRSFRGNDNSVRLWDIATGSQLQLFKPNSGEVSSVAFSPDGTKILVGISSDPWGRRDHDKIKVWDAATGRLLRTFTAGHSKAVAPRVLVAVSSVAFSPDGTHILSGGWDNTIRLRDTTSGRLIRTFPGHKSSNSHVYVTSVKFSPDGGQVLSGGIDGTARLWDVASGKLLRTLEGHSTSVSSVAYSPDGSLAVTGSYDHTLKLWEVATGRLLRTLGGQSSAINSVAVSRDGNRILSGGDDQSVKLWDLASGQLVRVFSGHEAAVTSVAFSPDGAEVRSGGTDGVVKFWNAESGKLTTNFASGGTSYAASFAFSSLPAKVAYGRGDGTVQLWDVTTGKRLRHWTHVQRLPPHCTSRSTCPISVGSVAFASDGTHVVSGSQDGTTKVWDAETGRLVSVFALKWGYVNAVVFSPDRTRILTGHLDNGVRLIDAASGRLLRLLHGHTGPASAVAFSPDGARVLSGGWDNDVHLWQADTGRLIHTFRGHSGKVSSVKFTPDGARIVTAGDDTTMKVWKVETGELLATFVGRKDGDWLAITPEGFFNASGNTGELLSVVRGLEVYSIDQVYQSLYRPDLVREKLAGDPKGKVREAAARLDLRKVLASGAAPRVTIAAPASSAKADTDEVAVEAAIADQGGGIGRVEWRVNGVTLGLEERGLARVEGGAAPAQTLRRTLSLEPGENSIEVVAYNGKNLIASEPARVTVSWDGERSVAPPKLHVLAVGVNDYWDSRLKLTYAVSDAKALGAALKQAGAGLYGAGGVKVTTLADAEVTVANLDKAFAAVAKEVHPRDAFALFVAGHGKTLNGRYYFLPHDFRYQGEESFEKQGINQEHLQGWLAQIRARKTILLFDTCESGSLTGDRLAVRGLERVAAVERLTRAMGRTVLSASSDDAPAIEGYRGHGAFTYVLLEAFGAADINNNSLIEVGEIADYLEEKLPELTYRTFKLRQVPHRKMVGNNFALAGQAVVLHASGAVPGPVLRPAPGVAAAGRPTHVVTAATAVREAANGTAAVVVELSPGMQVSLVEASGGWALVARDGKRLGYVEDKALARLQ